MSILLLKLNSKHYICKVNKRNEKIVYSLINIKLSNLQHLNKKFNFANINESWTKIFYGSCTLMFF
jgi:hypothetical protein